jgi:alpha-tubulin suppressor-like RCC1 family protein
MSNQFLSPEGDIENYFVTEYWLIDQYIGDSLWTWGGGSYGRLGNADITNRSTPVTTFAGGTNWKQVGCGGGHIAAIKTDGTLWTWGFAAFGQLGNAVLGLRSTPVTTFAGGTNWKQVSCGGYHTAAIKTDGTLWTWGSSSNGRLGNATITPDISTPVTTFAGGTNWKQVSCGNNHTAAIKTDGTLWTWGEGSGGRLGNAAITDRSTPVTTFSGGTNWKQASCGSNYMTAIKTDGTLWTWGANGVGQLGNASVTDTSTPVTTFAGGTNWKQVSCRGGITSAIKTDGTLWTWGSSSNGRLGNATITPDISTPVTTFAGGTNWKQVSGGGSHIAAIKTDGTLWTWGEGTGGRLGNASTADISTPVTTFAGGTNWKQVDSGDFNIVAVTTGISPDLPLS